MADLPAWDQDQVIRWYQVDVQVPGPWCSQKKAFKLAFHICQLILITTCELGFQLKYVTYNLHNTFINTLILIREVRSWPGMFHSNTRHCSWLMDRRQVAAVGAIRLTGIVFKRCSAISHCAPLEQAVMAALHMVGPTCRYPTGQKDSNEAFRDTS